MYPQPGQTGQWNPNPPPPSSGAGPQQQAAPQWAPSPGLQQSPQSHQPQPNGQYGRPQQGQMPPMAQGHQAPPPNMATMQPQHPDQYRSLPPPGAMYSHSPYHPQPQMPYAPHQPAPRQRTAIACRYCRRRKIRCSGFDQSEDGRCTNCQRFSQECVFTPVNQQTQAFVPAHAVLGRQGQMPTQFFGAFGQPIAPPYHYPQQAYGPPNGHYQQPAPYPPHMQQPQPGQPGVHQGGQQPSPTQSTQQPALGGQYPQSPAQATHQHTQQSPGQQPVQMAGQKRPNEEPHTPTAAPPNPALAAQSGHTQQRSGSASSSTSVQHLIQAASSKPPQPSPKSSAALSDQLHGVSYGAAPKENSADAQAVEQNGYPAPDNEADARLPPQEGTPAASILTLTDKD
ncbi:hypothetical protein ANO11243_076470 [Dothideomycetidae sp. 11243]|nr:hypothetical protein ANO11243_076470 [fungal sp. No.11243]